MLRYHAEKLFISSFMDCAPLLFVRQRAALLGRGCPFSGLLFRHAASVPDQFYL